MSLSPGTRLGPYEITAPLGAGGMGEVYRAHDSKLKRDVAIKILPDAVRRDPDRIARFEREAQVLASLKHPNIGSVYGLEENEHASAIVMELVEGEDLSQLIDGTPVPVPRALDIARQVAAALEAAHGQGVIHRDLKPANVRVQPDGLVKVLDFGLAKSLAADGGTMTQTALSHPGTIVGTAAYMSPEQARGEATGPATDVWAFGVVLYEMLSGISPFARPSTAETLAQVLAASPDESRLPNTVPARIRRLMRRCLERDPRRRWRHMGDVGIEIEDAEPAPGEEEARSAPAPGAVAITRRRAIGYGAAAVATLATGVGAGLWLGRGRGRVLPSYRRLTFRRGLIRSARVAPDGQTILYSALWDTDRCRVHTVRVDGPESRALDLPEANLLAVSRSGELAVALGSHDQGIFTYGTLARVPMAGGTPREVLEDVKFADWSPSGTDLAIVRRVDGLDRLEYPIGTVLVASAGEQGRSLGFPRVSPDGNRVAFVHYTGGSLSLIGHVSIVDRSGTVTVLSPDYLNIHGLAWNGDEIVYAAADERPLFRGFHAVRPGAAARTLTRVPGNTTLWDVLPDGRLVTAQTDDRAVSITRLGGQTDERDLSWLDASWAEDLSPDGRWLLFTEYGEGGGPEGAAYLRDTGGLSAIRLGPGRAVALSPDARWAICASGDGRADLVPTGAGEPRSLKTDGLLLDTARWLPDGTRLAFTAKKPGGASGLFLYDLERDTIAPVAPEGVSSWAVSPDGVAVAVRGSDAVIRRYGFDNAEPREMAGLTGGEIVVGWITGGLLVARPRDPAAPLGEIYRLDPNTSRLEPWQNILPQDRTGIMGQMAFRVTPDGRSLAYTWHRALSSLYLAGGIV